MRIQHNIAAINTFRQQQTNTQQTSKALEKLASGMRIGRAGDDAAGLAISEKMRAQIRGLSQASRNAQDAISLIQTAEGGAASIHAMLQRMRELSVQAVNDTMTNDDRSKLQGEMTELSSQIDVAATHTEFNTLKLLNRTGDGTSDFTGISQSAIDQLTSNLPGWINDSLTAISNQLGIALPNTPINRPMAIEYFYDTDANAAGAMMGTVDGSALTLRVNVAKVFDGSG